ncbi:thioredoxin-like protein 1 [Moniliophthora roreri MCA 2997]|uniref:Thioredoxin-like protein 1 n=2 Tax=Moniliophthora roreri TaxID=221103 RepID=V2YED7_MONRO|nr:thioredoxin-like protein 1 [Moniliophthora roreri MCA 2997]KAI3613695.1 thioredoxin-like protein 1 [Moniliophthora roreri]
MSNLPGASKSSKEQGDVSLLEFLDLQQLNCLNESPDHRLKPIVESKSMNKSSEKFLQSDADEQLLLNIAFNQTVRVKSIIIKSEDTSKAPKLIKLTVNKPSLGFDDVADAKEPAVAQIFELSEEDVKGKPIQLRFVRFQSVNSLHIFVASNQGDEEETIINAIDVIGVPVETTKDLSRLKQQEE